MTTIVAWTKRFLTAWALAQVVSAGILFYGAGLVLAFSMRRENAAVPFILFTVLVPSGFGALTVFWYRLWRRRTGIPRPEINLILGSIVFMPLYFEIVSLFISKPRPIVLRAIAEDLFFYYLMLPITVTLMGAYTATLGGLGFAIVSTVVTGALIRRRDSPRPVSFPS